MSNMPRKENWRPIIKNMAWTVFLVLLAAWLTNLEALREEKKERMSVMLLVGGMILLVWVRSWLERSVTRVLQNFWTRKNAPAGGKTAPPEGLPKFSASLVSGIQQTLVIGLVFLLLLRLPQPDGLTLEEHLEHMGYDLLRSMLPHSETDGPVVILDTSQVPLDTPSGGRIIDLSASVGGFLALLSSAPVPGLPVGMAFLAQRHEFPREPVTDRRVLQEFLEKLTDRGNAENLPQVVGIDINFHADRGVFLHPDDDRFFQFCLDLEDKTKNSDYPHPMKIFLGVHHIEGIPREQWLGIEKFASLAAYIGVPREDQGHLYASFTTPGQKPQPLRIMGVALAQNVRPRLTALQRLGKEKDGFHQPPWPLALFSPHEVPQKGEVPKQGEGPRKGRSREKYHALTFLADYSSLSTFPKPFRDPELDFPSPDRDSKRQGRHQELTPQLETFSNFASLKDKIVLLGDVRDASVRDSFVILGEKRPVPGVYLHACAAITLSRSPLFELHARDSVDYLLGFGILIWVTWLRWCSEKAGKRLSEESLPPAVGLVIVAIVTFSLLLVFLRIFWPDVVIVAFLLGLHPLAEWIWHTLSHAFHRPWLVRQPAGGREGKTP